MSLEEPPQSSSQQSKSWLEKLSQILTGEPQDLQDLLVVLREARANHVLTADAFYMIQGVLRIAQLRARDIMIPRIQMVVVPKEASLESIMPLVLEHGHSRFPVIEEDRSHVVGVLLAKDILAHTQVDLSITVDQIMRPALLVPESKRLNVLLREFRTNRNHMAIVVDEYGCTAGVLTIEDVLEQIVGQIEDEYDEEEEANILERKEHEYLLKALTPIDEFDDYFGSQLQSDEYDTIAGFIVTRLGHLPKKGEKVLEGPFRFEVMHADSRRIHLLKLKLLEQDSSS
ncbi:MAG: transporter associated domain-containing protein [Methylococcales bacterium]|nr:transporter associated domain-containing protein [Methylococcales bacterium]